MQQATLRTHKHPHWTHGMALERRFFYPRGMLLSAASNSDTLLDRVLGAAHLDSAALNQLARILTVTVQDWVRK